MADPCILMCAPNGARRTKADHPALPIAPNELAACAADTLAAGASILHLHVRDEKGGHTLAVEPYRKAIAAIRARVGDRLIIQVTSESVGRYGPQDQVAMIRELRPEAVSVALRELLPDDTANAEQRDFFKWMRGEGIFYQIILYDAADVARFEQFCEAGLFGAVAPFVLFVAGRYGEEATASGACFEYFAPRAASLPFSWALCSFGRTEHEAVSFAATHGGHVRVGFENNLWRKDGTPVSDNAELVRLAAETVASAGRSVATAEDVRRMFRLSQQ